MALTLTSVLFFTSYVKGARTENLSSTHRSLSEWSGAPSPDLVFFSLVNRVRKLVYQILSSSTFTPICSACCCQTQVFSLCPCSPLTFCCRGLRGPWASQSCLLPARRWDGCESLLSYCWPSDWVLRLLIQTHAPLMVQQRRQKKLGIRLFPSPELHAQVQARKTQLRCEAVQVHHWGLGI